MIDPSNPAGLAGVRPRQWEGAVERFEEAWQRGDRPLLEDYLPAGPARHAALVELAHVDLEYRLKAGEAARVEDYLRRYPELAGDRDEVLDLLAAEYRLRRRREPLVTPAEYAARFPDRHAELLARCAVPRSPQTTPPLDPEATGPPPPGFEGDNTAAEPPGAVRTGAEYRVLRLHARGGLGEILLAVDEQLHREVALKLLQPTHAHHPASRARFLREAAITSQLEHPGVVPVYGLGRLSDGNPVYAMRFIRGETLQDAVARFHQDENQTSRQRRLALHHLLTRFVAVCNAVAYAHSQGVVHRDLKPSNVMLGEYGETLVVDWGLARPFGRPEAEAEPPAGPDGEGTTQVGVLAGTPAFMAPEQASGRPDLLGPATDIYALGATLYVLLTSRPPFQDALLTDLLDRVRRGEFPAPCQVRKNVPRALEAICLKAMSRRPEDRYAGALDLARDLEHWLADEPVGAWREPLAARARRWLARHSTLAASAAVTLLAAAVLAAVTSALTAARAREESARKEEASARQLAELRSAEDRRQLAQADRAAYYHRINDADRAIWAGDLRRAADDLAVCKPELRAWEYYYLQRLREGALLTLRGHQMSVWVVGYRPDGRRLASSSVDKTVRIWDAATGRQLFLLEGHKGYVWGLAWSPDGRRLASAGADGLVKLWDADAGKELHTFTLPGWEIYGLAFHPHGRYLALAATQTGGPGPMSRWPGRVQLLDTEAGEVLWTGYQPGGARAVAFRPDGKEFATAGGDGGVRVWEVRRLPGRASERTLERLPPQGPLNGMAYSPDGKQIATASADHTVWLRDAATGKRLRTLYGHGNQVWGVAFSPDGKRLASSSDDRTIMVWDVAHSCLLLTLHGHHLGIASVVFSPDGTRIASGADDGTVRVWDATRRKAYRTLCGHTGGVAATAFHPDGRLVATGGTDDGTVRLWDAVTGKPLRTLTAKSVCNRMAFSPDGALLASAHDDGTVRLWHVPSGEARASLRGHTAKVSDVAFSPDGKVLASAGQDRTVRLWDVATGKELRQLKGHTDKVWAVAFSPDGAVLASGGADKVVCLWDPVTGARLRTLGGHDSAVLSLAFRPDGRALAAGTAAIDRVIVHDPGAIKLWDLDGRREPLTLRGHLRDVSGLSFQPDGRRLASAGSDGTVRLWEPETGQEVLSLYGHLGPVHGVAFSPDGRRLASAGGGTAIVWDGTPE